MRVLQFSGGRDSLACLYLLKKQWHDITVFWMDAGDAYPETRVQMKAIAEMVPHFESRQANVLDSFTRNGLPLDVVVSKHTRLGKSVTSSVGLAHRSQWECCSENIWVPMAAAMKELGATEIIRGQRLEEAYKSEARDGQVIDGFVYRYPIENWTHADVSRFLAKSRVAEPAHYASTEKSLDCLHCTAYLDERRGQFRYLRDNYPAVHQVTVQALKQVYRQVADSVSHIDNIVAEGNTAPHLAPTLH